MPFPSFQYFRVSSPREWVAHVEINRPEKMNAFTEDMWNELETVFDRLSYDPSVRAVVFSGAGDRAFCAGLDLTKATERGTPFNPLPEDGADAGRYAKQVRRFVINAQNRVSSIERCEKPVICVLHGIAFGLAIDMATCADLRLCTADVSLAVVGSYAWVKEVSMTARTFGAQEALRVGLVNSFHPTKADALAEAFRLASVMAAKSPVAVQGTKNFLDWSRDHDVTTGLKYTAVWNAGTLSSKDVPESIAAIRTKKVPKFAKL